MRYQLLAGASICVLAMCVLCDAAQAQQINVTTANGVGVDIGAGVNQTVNDTTINLGALGTTGALAHDGGDISIGGPSAVVSTATTAANASAQTGLRANGEGSTISATGALIDLTPSNAADTADLAVSNLVGVRAEAQADIVLSGTTVITRATSGAANAANHGLSADGVGSTITVTGGSVSVGGRNANAANNARGAFGAYATNGGQITFNGAATITTNGSVVAATGIGGSALYANGAGSTITSTGSIVTTLGIAANGARAEGGATISLTGGEVSTSGASQQIGATHFAAHGLYALGAGSGVSAQDLTINVTGLNASGARTDGGELSLTGVAIQVSGAASADTQPNSGVRVTVGGSANVTDTTVAGTFVTNGRAHGLSVEDSGSTATVVNSSFSAAGTRANAARVISGAVLNANATAFNSTGSHAVSVEGAAARFEDSTIAASTPVETIGYGVRVGLGADVVIIGGSVSSTGRDSPGLSAGLSTVTVMDAAISTTGKDNSHGVASDGSSTVSVSGGSITTSGASVRDGARPIGAVARNPGGALIITNTPILTRGAEAFGANADDGGTLTLNTLSVRTEDVTNAGPRGAGAIGLFVTAEQTGAQFAAALTGNGVTVETLGPAAHGAAAQARNDIPTELAQLTLNDSSVTTHGAAAQGLRAVLGDYGSRPQSGRGEAAIIVNTSVVRTEGASAYGAYSRDNPTSVTMNDTAVQTSGPAAHGAVAVQGGQIVGLRASVEAAGSEASALFVTSDAAPVSTAAFTNSTLANVSGPGIGVAGLGDVALAGSSVGGSGEWLRVGTLDDFAQLGAEGRLVGGSSDALDDSEAPLPPPPPLGQAPVLPAPTPGLANITLTQSHATGSAFTATGSVSNLTMSSASRWDMTGNSNITNLVNDASFIQFSAPAGDLTQLASYKTLTVVNYVGVAGEIGLNTYFGDDTSPSDRLVIDHGTGSGDTILSFTRVAGEGALTTGDGILVVDDITGNTTTPTAFALGVPAIPVGPFDYTLHRGGAAPDATSDWFLRSTINCAGPDAPIPPCPAPPPVPPPPAPPEPAPPDPTPPVPPNPAPNYRQEVSLYTALPSIAQLYGRALLDTLHQRVGEEELLRRNASLNDDEDVDGWWGRIIGQRGERESNLGIYGRGPQFDWDLYALQVGLELYRGRDEDERNHAGLTAALGRIEGEVRHFDGRGAGSNDIDVYSFGGYWTHFDDDGAYLDAILQLSWYDITAHSPRMAALSTDGFGAAASIEIGKPFDLEDNQTVLQRGWVMEPQGQLIFQWFDFDDTQDAAARVYFDNAESLLGRLGVRVANTVHWTENSDRFTTFWGRVNIWHEFFDPPETAFSSESGPVAFRSDIGDTWWDVNGGASLQLSQAVTLNLDGGYMWADDQHGESMHARIGMRVNW